MSEGLVLQNDLGQIIDFNASATRFLGLTPDELSGRTSMDPRWQARKPSGEAFPGNEHPAMVTLATGKPMNQVPMVLKKKDGSMAWISINTVPVFDEEDPVRPSQVISTFSDVTHFQKLEKELSETLQFVPIGIIKMDMNKIKVKRIVSNSYFFTNKETIYFIGVAFKGNSTIFVYSSFGSVEKSFIQLYW
jgi:PAS domain S-box-containing protein